MIERVSCLCLTYACNHVIEKLRFQSFQEAMCENFRLYLRSFFSFKKEFLFKREVGLFNERAFVQIGDQLLFKPVEISSSAHACQFNVANDY